MCEQRNDFAHTPCTPCSTQSQTQHNPCLSYFCWKIEKHLSWSDEQQFQQSEPLPADRWCVFLPLFVESFQLPDKIPSHHSFFIFPRIGSIFISLSHQERHKTTSQNAFDTEGKNTEISVQKAPRAKCRMVRFSFCAFEMAVDEPGRSTFASVEHDCDPNGPRF